MNSASERAKTGSKVVRRNMIQLFLFALVGVSNTAIDFGVTNLLYFLTHTDSRVGLLLISVTACLVATANSYLLNRRFTFRNAGGTTDHKTPVKFYGVAMVTMVINTSVFLFFAKYLPDQFAMHPVLAINVAKFLGVVVALSVSFFGFRFGVFQTSSVMRFRRAFQFEDQGRMPSLSFPGQAGALVAAAIVVRVGYLCLTTAIGGDAVKYATVAGGIASGDFAGVDAFWHSLFTYWQAPFNWLGAGKVTAVVLSTLVPGVLLLVPVAWMARSLGGPVVAWLAGGFCVFHPRLVEFSCNGYAESFYLFLFAVAIAFMMLAFQNRSLWPALLCGGAFGLYACVRSEGLFAFLMAVPLLAVVGWSSNRSPGETGKEDTPSPGRLRRVLAPPAIALAGFAAALLLYMGLSYATLGSPGLFQKTTNLAKQFSEQLDPRQAARETYGATGSLYGAEKEKPAFSKIAAVLIQRFPRNLLYCLERLPGILLSPVFFFMLLLPFFVIWRNRGALKELPLYVMLFFPILFFPLIQVEPRLFLPMLIPVHVFGAAGLVAFCEYAARRGTIGRSSMLAAAAVAVLLLTTGVTVWRGLSLEKKYQFQRETAAWVKHHVPPEDRIIGCGYGFVSTTRFLSGHDGSPRIWTDNAADLAAFADSKAARWLILYEAYLVKANPELLPALEAGVPGFTLKHRIEDRAGKRIQVYRRVNGAHPGVLTVD